VGRDGAIDWFCPGRFEAPSLFAAILDADRGGSFRVAPTVPCASKQLYLPDTAVLLTRFYSDRGVAEATDLMPVGLEPCALVRRVDVVRGHVDLRMSCRPALDYARAGHRLSLDDPRLARFVAGDGSGTELAASLPMSPDGPAARCRFGLRSGERACSCCSRRGAASAGPAAVERDLVSDSLVYRYDPGRASDDGLGGASEGSFSLCSFWLAECFTRAGGGSRTRPTFEKMLTYASNLGLFGEQVGLTGEALGNYRRRSPTSGSSRRPGT
jgi:GH15 family glucan-1,4-alpha-glucosidase